MGLKGQKKLIANSRFHKPLTQDQGSASIFDKHRSTTAFRDFSSFYFSRFGLFSSDLWRSLLCLGIRVSSKIALSLRGTPLVENSNPAASGIAKGFHAEG